MGTSGVSVPLLAGYVWAVWQVVIFWVLVGLALLVGFCLNVCFWWHWGWFPKRYIDRLERIALALENKKSF